MWGTTAFRKFAFESGNLGAVDEHCSLRVISSDRAVPNQIFGEEGLKKGLARTVEFTVETSGSISGSDLSLCEPFFGTCYSRQQSIGCNSFFSS